MNKSVAERESHGRAGIALVAALLALVSFTGFAADPAITVSAQQRYPWNGLVDINFTITGTSGTKYDTSFSAKDMVGNTNIAIRTIRKSDGTAAAAKEQLLPGTYNWVWDAVADLPKDFKCDRVTVTGTAVEGHGKVQLWSGGPYWATMNIGATKPEEYGYYFWWGDIVGYKREGNKWVASDGSTTSFPSSAPSRGQWDELQKKGWTTSGKVLAPEHDAARVHWGAGWRMPTFNELKNLVDKCDWTWSTVNGVKGYIVRGRSSYASANIFIPAAGYTYGSDSSYTGANSSGYYWSSVPNTDGYSTFGYNSSLRLTFTSSKHSYGTNGTTDSSDLSNCVDRSAGLSIRPVRSAN